MMAGPATRVGLWGRERAGLAACDAWSFVRGRSASGAEPRLKKFYPRDECAIVALNLMHMFPGRLDSVRCPNSVGLAVSFGRQQRQQWLAEAITPAIRIPYDEACHLFWILNGLLIARLVYLPGGPRRKLRRPILAQCVEVAVDEYPHCAREIDPGCWVMRDSADQIIQREALAPENLIKSVPKKPPPAVCSIALRQL